VCIRFERFKGSLSKNFYQDNVESPLRALLGRWRELERENAMRGSNTLNKTDRRLEALMININKKQDGRGEKMSSTPLDGAATMAKLESMEEKFQELGEKSTGHDVLAAKKFMNHAESSGLAKGEESVFPLVQTATDGLT
jgi:hypothetical protein